MLINTAHRADNIVALLIERYIVAELIPRRVIRRGPAKFRNPDLVIANASTEELRAAARKYSMSTLREAGLRALYAGVTTVEEVVRETVMEDEI